MHGVLTAVCVANGINRGDVEPYKFNGFFLILRSNIFF